MCVGCGTEVTSSSRNSSVGMIAGAEAVDPAQSKTKSKKARFVDPTDKSQNTGFLCHRCQALQSNNIWKAYDALRDVSPAVFNDQLRHIVARRKFGLCVLVVDATDPEHTAVKNLRRAIGSTPTILVFNKIDLVPRMSPRDQRLLVRKIEQKSTRFIGYEAVSAETGAGLVALAQRILEDLGGKDVFVVGAANVGKSSLVKRLSVLIAESVRLKGPNKAAMKRRQMTKDLKVTGSNLPGTTLQAVRVPCFPSRGHALWDTPGIINLRALQYHIFPAHLMEPLTHPSAIQIPTHDNGLVHALRSGQSLLIEAPWMDQENDGDGEGQNRSDEPSQPCVLARVDIVDVYRTVHTQAFVHPSLRIRVVPTKDAPSNATIPPSHIERVKKHIRKATGQHETGLADAYSLPLKPHTYKERPDGEIVPGEGEYAPGPGKYAMDISFASLGWISFLDEKQYSVIPHCVQGSVFSMRPALYPVTLAKWLDEHGSPEHFPDELDDNNMLSIRRAADEGRHSSNRQKRENVAEYDEWYD